MNLNFQNILIKIPFFQKIKINILKKEKKKKGHKNRLKKI